MASDTVALFGMPITNVNMAQAVDRIEGYILSGKVHQIATANLDFARHALRDPYLQRILCECSMVLADGAPMFWAASLFGSPLQQRVTGVDLIPELARLSQEKGYRIYLLGSREQSFDAAVAHLTQRFPGIHIVGRDCPPVAPLHQMDHEELLRKIHAARPDILLIGFGNPKQEIWIHRHRDRLPPSVVIGIGGSLDLIASSLRRAPRWVRALHLQWIFRLAPSSLLRYVQVAFALLNHLPLGFVAQRLQPNERRQRGSMVDVERGVRVVATPGKLGGRATSLIVAEARVAAKAGASLVIDMSATLRVESEGLGGLLEARRLMLDQGLWIWLTAMSHPVRRMLQCSAVVDLFRIAATPAAAIQSTLAAETGLRMALKARAVNAACAKAARAGRNADTAKAS